MLMLATPHAAGGDAPSSAIIHAPLSALPVTFPRERFLQAKQAATAFNSLVDAVAADEQYLEATLEAASQHDDFTARLLWVLRESRPQRQARSGSEIELGIHRSDYMLDQPSGRFLQVSGCQPGPAGSMQACMHVVRCPRPSPDQVC